MSDAGQMTRAEDSRPAEALGRRRRRRRNGRGARPGAVPAVLVAWLLGVLLVGAPLAFGAVHRTSLLVVLALEAALGLATTWLAVKRPSSPTTLVAVALPLVFLLIAAVQIVPVPAGLRSLLDPKGSELLALAQLDSAHPMSLDPPETYRRLAEAAAALTVTLAALLLATSRRFRHVAPGVVASAGLAALIIGLGHRAIFEDKIYGLIPSGRGLPVGPFINPNHTAEFLELAAFAALAFAFSRPSRDGQRVWQILAAVLAAGALSTLSRGAVLALGSGALTWFLLAPRSDEGEPLHRTRFAGGVIGLLVVGGLAIAFGAEKIGGALFASQGDSLVKVKVWLDALKIIPAHPAGIGLGAFGRVYPVYQTLPSLSWFQFVENQPLGILIEAGIPGALLLLGACGWVVRRFARQARRDRVEAALAAGLVAVLAHNLADFGLEMPGILLPFCALLGVLFGRQAEVPADAAPRRAPVVLAGLAAAAVLAGIALVSSRSMRNFDALLRPPLPVDARSLAQEASRAHPTDYVYALAQARLEPRDPASLQHRLRLLNRAMILCPRCDLAHAEAARDLWRLGRRQQALLEWRTMLALKPDRLWSTVGELARSGATPAELTTLADEQNRHDLSRLLLQHGMVDGARQVLAGSREPDGIEYNLVAAQIALRAKDLSAARAAAARAMAFLPRDARAFAVAASIELAARDQEKATAILIDGLRAEPMSVDLNRMLLDLLMQTDRWRDTDRALEGLRRALGESGAPMTEANLAAARIFERRGQYLRALAEYQAAAMLAPNDVGLLLALGRAAEQAGRVTVATDAYRAILRLAPGHAAASAALDNIQKDKKALELVGTSPMPTGRAGK
jgi:tetratricopeptide (TPR) repeat protein